MVKRHLEAPETIVKVEDERMQLVEIYKDKARACAVGITDEKIAKSSALQLATASGICTDKALLLQGMPTLGDHFKSGQQLSLQNRPTEVAVRD